MSLIASFSGGAAFIAVCRPLLDLAESVANADGTGLTSSDAGGMGNDEEDVAPTIY